MINVVSLIELIKLTDILDQWNIYPGYICDDYYEISAIWDHDPETQISSLEECIEHCKTFDDCVAAQFYDYTDSDLVEEKDQSLTFCLASSDCYDHKYKGEWWNGVIPELAILA